MDTKTFAQKIRQKYPGSYDDISDIELANKIVTKYPTYKEQITDFKEVTRPTSLKDKFLGVGKSIAGDIVQAPENIINTATDIVGATARKVGGELGEAIGTREEPTKPFREILQEEGQINSNISGAINPEIRSATRDITTLKGAGQLAGDIGQTALTLVAPEVKGITLASKVGQGALKLGGAGAGLGLSEGLQEGADVLDTAIKTGVGATGGALLGTALPLIGKALGKLAPNEQFLKETILEKYTKAIKPSVTGKKTNQAVEKYNEDLFTALNSINKNKESLTFTDELGESLKGQTPSSLKEFSEAIEQTKKSIFSQYNNLAKQAGESNIKIESAPIIKELSDISNNKALELSSPKTIGYVEDWMGRLQRNPELDPVTTQEVVQNLNKSLESFYRNPSYETASQAGIDALIANKFRQQLDEQITNLTGSQYGALKAEYGALKSIENDVVKAMQRDARRNIKGLIDFADIFSAGDVVNGILTMNPAQIAKGAIQKAITETFKKLNNPNRVIKELFDLVEKTQPLSRSSKSLNSQLQSQAVSKVRGTPSNISNISPDIPQSAKSASGKVLGTGAGLGGVGLLASEESGALPEDFASQTEVTVDMIPKIKDILTVKENSGKLNYSQMDEETGKTAVGPYQITKSLFDQAKKQFPQELEKYKTWSSIKGKKEPQELITDLMLNYYIDNDRPFTNQEGPATLEQIFGIWRKGVAGASKKTGVSYANDATKKFLEKYGLKTDKNFSNLKQI